MKIDYVIVSTDGNSLYDGFDEIVKKVWFPLVGVKPIIVKIGESNFVEEFDDHLIVGYKKVEGVNTGLQSQIARLYVTSLFKDKTFLISDLDMIPLSKSYFIDNATPVDDNNVLIYTADAYGYGNQKRYPMCYNLAKGSTYHEIMNLDSTFEEFVKRLSDMKLGWDTDELFWGGCVYEFEQQNPNRITKLHRGFAEGFATKRIDRSNWHHPKNDFSKISQGEYIDSHMLRPYKTYKHQIDNLINLLEIK